MKANKLNASLATCVIRVSADFTHLIHDALRDLPGVLEPVGPDLDLRPTWGMRISLMVAAVDGYSPVACLGAAGIGRAGRARCLAVEVCETGVGRVIGDAANDPIGASLWVQSCVQYRKSLGVAGARALRRHLDVGRAGGFSELHLGDWVAFTRWDDVMAPHGRAGANDARACIKRAEAAGLCFEASVPALHGDWDGCEARSVSVTHRTCAGASAAPPCGAHWLGDAEPVQLSLNIDARGERSLIVGARTWTPVYATRNDSSSATRLGLEVAA
jgi:hypothetical protein